MQPIPTDWLVLDESRCVAQDELAQMCGLAAAEIAELVEYGALQPVEEPAQGLVFSAAQVPALREAARLRADYDLDVFTVGVLLGYLRRIAQLERDLQALRAQLGDGPHTMRDGPGSWREPHA